MNAGSDPNKPLLLNNNQPIHKDATLLLKPHF